MPVNPLTAQETERLQQLYSYDILDSLPEKEFEELADLAATLCNCPVASITFIDKNRQWFKARKGDDTRETARHTSFCTFTIEGDELIVEDARKDPRFANNADVTGGLNIVFYAGITVYSSHGFKLGTVCVIDHQPRKLESAQIAALKIIASQVTHLLERRLRNKIIQEQTERILKETEKSFESYFAKDTLPKYIYDIGTLRVLQANESAMNIYGYTREEFLALTVFDIRDKNEKLHIRQLVQSLNTGNDSVSFETVHSKKSGDLMPVEVTVSNILYKGKKARLATMIDISEKLRLRKIVNRSKELMEEKMNQAKEEERDYIGKELHDNINQILASTKLFLEVAESNPDMKDAMIKLSKETVVEAIREIRALSRTLVTEQEEFNLVLSVNELINSYNITNAFHINFSLSGYIEEVPADIKLTLFRIIQEQLNNISKYAGATHVQLHITSNDKVAVTIKDNGKGFDTSAPREGIGLNNIQNRVQFYNGNMKIVSTLGKGAELLVEIPLAGTEIAL